MVKNVCDVQFTYTVHMMSNEGTVRFIVFLDTRNIWFGELILSLSLSLTKI